MKVEEFIKKVKELDEWFDGRYNKDMPIEIFDEQGNMIEDIRFSVNLSRDVLEINQ